MAFASAVKIRTVAGNKFLVTGTFTNGAGDTGGDITTGLSSVDFLLLQPSGSAVVATAAVVNETLPKSGGDVTIVSEANVDGNWLAMGT